MRLSGSNSDCVPQRSHRTGFTRACTYNLPSTTLRHLDVPSCLCRRRVGRSSRGRRVSLALAVLLRPVLGLAARTAPRTQDRVNALVLVHAERAAADCTRSRPGERLNAFVGGPDDRQRRVRRRQVLVLLQRVRECREAVVDDGGEVGWYQLASDLCEEIIVARSASNEDPPRPLTGVKRIKVLLEVRLGALRARADRVGVVLERSA